MRLSKNFFPMRPTATEELPTGKWLKKLVKDYIIQPKLNGDRAVLWVKADGIYVQNRRGGEYSFGVFNRTDFEKLPVGTILDGEVWQRKFWPFECLAYGDLDLTERGPEIRCTMAEKISQMLGHEFIFQPVDAKWLQNAERGVWEGFVAKRRGTPYRPAHRAQAHSWGWYKFKWPQHQFSIQTT